jgi:hypothetical protein
MPKLKPGVRLTGIRPEILFAVMAAERAYNRAGHELVVTSCVDSKHGRGSLHYSGAAVDLRTRDVPSDAMQGIVTEIRESLGPDFDVILESDHLHAEYHPK